MKMFLLLSKCTYIDNIYKINSLLNNPNSNARHFPFSHTPPLNFT